MGDRTGVELPGETRGLLRRFQCRDRNDNYCWSPVSHEYIAFGHEIGATALQLARAVSVIANDGMLVQPHLVVGKSRPRPDGSLEEIPVKAPEPVRALRPETAHRVRLIMQQVVQEGTGKRAALPGWTAGGKTGSAEMFVPGQGWVDRHNSSFIGFAPVTNPRIAVVVTISDTPLQGGIAAAPVFKDVASAALRTLNVVKDDLEHDLKPGQSGPVENMKIVAEPPPQNIARVEPKPEPAGPPARPEGPAIIAGPQVPDFRGKSVLAVLRESASMKLPIEIVGSGVARLQRPVPGTFLPAGQKIQVEFARP
jgi:membrane peptidoglycan carboxypeptidase